MPGVVNKEFLEWGVMALFNKAHSRGRQTCGRTRALTRQITVTHNRLTELAGGGPLAGRRELVHSGGLVCWLASGGGVTSAHSLVSPLTCGRFQRGGQTFQPCSLVVSFAFSQNTLCNCSHHYFTFSYSMKVRSIAIVFYFQN